MASGSLFIKPEKPFDEPDLSRPWKLSDVVLSVEDKKFHVHRCILAIWSPVFEKIFTSNFKEKYQDEIPLPGKKAIEIQEMLSIVYLKIYLKEKKVTHKSVFFLLKLAEEYQMENLRSLCEKCLIEHTTKDKAIEFLVIAETYNLEQLSKVCIELGAELTPKEIHSNEKYSRLNPLCKQRLAERREEYVMKRSAVFAADLGTNFRVSER